MNWLDIEDIAELLDQKYPTQDIYSLKFTDLKQMVIDLEDFEGEEHKCNEKILEAIQGMWFKVKNN